MNNLWLPKICWNGPSQRGNIERWSSWKIKWNSPAALESNREVSKQGRSWLIVLGWRATCGEAQATSPCQKQYQTQTSWLWIWNSRKSSCSKMYQGLLVQFHYMKGFEWRTEWGRPNRTAGTHSFVKRREAAKEKFERNPVQGSGKNNVPDSQNLFRLPLLLKFPADARPRIKSGPP